MKQRSMLHQETLTLFDYFARRARHGILEIGAYIGGGTAVIAQALKESGSDIPFVTCEPGGSHDNHPHIPSSDILADLKKTLSDHALLGCVKIVEGWSNTSNTVETVNAIFGEQGIDLIIVDVDGGIERDFNLYRPLLRPGAIIVCDDYICDGQNAKELPTRKWVHEAVGRRIVHTLGVVKWGTWFGVYSGRPRI
jgi:predicted O-methyltransferase YrrM